MGRVIIGMVMGVFVQVLLILMVPVHNHRPAAVIIPTGTMEAVLAEVRVPILAVEVPVQAIIVKGLVVAEEPI